MQKKRLPIFKRSIRSQTLVCFMVLVFVVISLLWAVQEWFFSTQFLRLKEREILKLVEHTPDFNIVQSSQTKEFFEDLHQLAVKNNLLIYYFGFNGRAEFRKDENNNYFEDENRLPILELKGFFSEQRVLSPAVKEGDIVQSIPWDSNGYTQSRFVRLLGGSVGALGSGPASEFSAEKDRLYYAAECKNNGREMRYFIYMEAVLSKEEITLGLVRIESLIITITCLVLALAFSLLLAQLLSSPITKISARANKLAEGDFDVRFDESGITEINSLASTLNYAAEEFSKTEQLRRDFIANISHDLRTPLTMVKAYAEMIRDLSGSKDEKTRKHAQVIVHEADRLTGLVQDIQNLSKLQSGTELLHESDFGLAAFCQNVINQFNVLHKHSGFTIRYDPPPEITVRADANKITQVLYNLIGNAINYTNQDQKQITLKVIPSQKSALVEIIDNGKGIAPEEIDSVWERYYRSNQTKRNVVGSGLGLSIVKGILEAHKAEYGVRSELGKGTTFWFKLPLADK